MSEVDDLMVRLCDAARREYGAGESFDLSIGDLVGRARREHDKRMEDAEAARLLPLGRDVAAGRMGKAVSTIYKMTHRHYDRFSTAAQQA